jgi:exosortase
MRDAASATDVSSKRTRMLVVAGLLVAVWPVWRWIAARLIDRSGDHWELLGALTALAFLWRDRQRNRGCTAVGFLPVVLLFVYALTYAFVPPLVRALMAAATIAAACSSLWYGQRIYLPILGLAFVSVPITASLDFYVGYPLRVLVGDATAWLLQTNGFLVEREGTMLLWNGQSVAIDAPCSGIKMLWTGAYLSSALAALLRLSNARTLVLAAGAVLVVLVANVLRSASLFYLETGLIEAPAQAHEAVGIVMFAIAAGTLAAMSQHLARVTHAH